MPRPKHLYAWMGATKFCPPPEVRPTEFDMLVKKLRLRPDVYLESALLKEWILTNYEQRYVPELLLEKMGLTVCSTFIEGIPDALWDRQTGAWAAAG